MGNCWQIGRGKTTLAHALRAGYFTQRYSFLPFASTPSHANRILPAKEQQHHFKNRSNTSDFYYQQRYNASDSEDTITVSGGFGAIDKRRSRQKLG